MKKPRHVIRDGKKYKVHKYIPEQKCVMVKSWFRFAQAPRNRELNMWWDLDECEKILY